MDTEEILEDVVLDLSEVLSEGDLDETHEHKIDEALLLITEVLESLGKKEE